MKKIISFVVLSIFCLSVNGQVNDKLSRRKVIIFTKYVGDLEVDVQKPLLDSVKDGKKIYLMGGAGDVQFGGVLPYSMDFPMTQYLDDLHQRKFNYLYKDVFLVTEVLRLLDSDLKSMGINPEENKKLEPKLHLETVPNTTYISYPAIKSVAKFWILDADWATLTINYKPNYLKQQSSPALAYDSYNIFVLRKIHSLTALSTLENSDGLKIVKDGILKSIKK